MTLPKRGTDSETIKSIKSLLWEGGLSQREIGVELGVSQGTVSNILRGYIGRDTRWPDDSLGHMPVERYKYLCWTQGVKSGKRTLKYSQENKYSPEAERAGTLLEEVRRRVDAGENIDDIKFDESGNLIPKKPKRN